MKGAGRSTRGIAGELGIAHDTVPRYQESPEAMRPTPRPRRGKKAGLLRRIRRTGDVRVALQRGFKALGYEGGYSILKSQVSPRRRRWQPNATMRFGAALVKKWL